MNNQGYSFVGFCAGTGSYAESNYIANWGFTSGYSPQVAEPTFSPDGAAYVTPQTLSVTMACATAGPRSITQLMARRRIHRLPSIPALR